MSGLQDYHHAEDKPDKTKRITTWVAHCTDSGQNGFLRS